MYCMVLAFLFFFFFFQAEDGIRDGTVTGVQTCALPISAQQRQVYMDAARTSWNFVNSITEPSTGLARAHARYSFVTLWDVAGVIAANYVAHELGFVNDATYDAHITRILATLSTIDLFE